MIIGIDHGNSQIKTVHAVFPAGVNEHGTAKPAIPTDMIKYDGNYYTLSNIRDAYKKDKTQDDKCFIMTLFAIAKELIATEQYKEGTVKVDLAAGLPPDHYAKLKEPFAAYFTDRGREWKFEYNGMPFDIRAGEVFVFPQAYSAIVSRSSFLKEFSSTYIVDIGGFTVDILLLSDGRPDLKCCRSLELGIIPMSSGMIHRVESEHGLVIGESHIRDVLTGKRTALDADIREFIRASAEGHAMKILNTLREARIDLRTNPVIFMGGGALMLEEFILGSGLVNTQYTEFIREVSANAIGYNSLAFAAMKKKK